MATLDDLEQRIATLEQRLGSQMLATMQTDLADVNDRTRRHDAALDQHTSSLANIERELGILRQTVDDGFAKMSAGLDQIVARLAGDREPPD